jgi:hypothetical protein
LANKTKLFFATSARSAKIANQKENNFAALAPVCLQFWKHLAESIFLCVSVAMQ